MEYLAGPALRHSNAREINIWLVLSQRANRIRAELSNYNNDILSQSVASSHTPVQAGERCFVYLLKVLPNDTVFPTEQVLYYDIVIDGKRLADFGLTSGDKRITYVHNALPTVVLKNKHQLILEGSCRHPHASKRNKHQPDMLASADDIMNDHHNDPTKRPSWLFLTGDQIYADNVVAPTLANIKKLVKQYIRHDEHIPTVGNASVQVSQLKLNARDTVFASNMGFTAIDKSNHILSFGEYFMMYCLVWGGPGTQCPAFDEVKDDFDYHYHDDVEDDFHERDNTQRKYNNERRVVNGFLHDAWRARRLMANTPTYMIFDDHEVTDDWNLDESNHQAFKHHLFSRHVQANALAAFWLCQGWGNTPDAFDHNNFMHPIEAYLNGYRQDDFAPYESALRNHYWGFELDAYPYTVVLDTRTHRAYNHSKIAKLMSRNALADVARRIQTYPEEQKSENSMLLVSAAPIYGFTAIERKQLLLKENLKHELDVECWIADEDAFKQIQSVIRESGFERCAVFSGDVHYGFCRHEKLISSLGKDVHIFQLTSSSLHNAPGFWAGLGLGVLKVKEVFAKRYSSYLIPNNSGGDFINQSTNIGILHLNNGNPEKFVLHSYPPSGYNANTWFKSGNGFAWTYDLNKRVKLKRPVDNNDDDWFEEEF